MTIYTPGITANFKAYFRVSPNSPLVDTDIIPTFTIQDPSNATIFSGTTLRLESGVYQASYLIPSNIDVTLEYKIKWNAILNGATLQGAEESFKISSPVVSFTNVVSESAIQIDSTFLNIIKSVLAYPCEDTLLLSDDQIKTIILYPVFMEYFTKFPIKYRDQKDISTFVSIPFPDQFTYSVTECRVVGKQSQGVGTNGSFWQLVMLNKGYGSGQGGFNTYGSQMRGFNPEGLRQSTRNLRYVLDSYGNDATFNYFVNKPLKQLEINSSSNAAVEIVWAKWSNNFEDIDYPRRKEVLKLAQSYLLDHWVRSVSLIDDGNTDQTLNFIDAQTKADALKQEVYDLWNKLQDPVVMRSS